MFLLFLRCNGNACLSIRYELNLGSFNRFNSCPIQLPNVSLSLGGSRFQVLLPPAARNLSVLKSLTAPATWAFSARCGRYWPILKVVFHCVVGVGWYATARTDLEGMQRRWWLTCKGSEINSGKNRWSKYSSSKLPRRMTNPAFLE